MTLRICMQITKNIRNKFYYFSKKSELRIKYVVRTKSTKIRLYIIISLNVLAEELSIVIANRSAALNHLEQYEDALADIRRCLSLGYPRNLRYKVYERRARSLLALKRNKESIKAFQ